MVKITWLGEDTEEVPGPSFNVWNEIKFPKGVAVEVTDAHMIAKARMNQFYTVEESQEAEHEAQAQVEGQGKIKTQAEVIKKPEPDYRKSEKSSGYSPSEKKPGKKKVKTETRPDGLPTADP